MAKKIKRHRLVQGQKQKLKVTTKIIIAGSASIFGLVAGIFVYLNVSQTEEMKAGVITQPDVILVQSDFNQPQLLVAPPEARLNGLRVKQARELTHAQQ